MQHRITFRTPAERDAESRAEAIAARRREQQRRAEVVCKQALRQALIGHAGRIGQAVGISAA